MAFGADPARLDAHSDGIIDVMTGAASLTCDRLAALLEREGCPADRYGIGRHGKYQDQAFVVERWSNRWVVYYTERGSKSGIRKHQTEDAACRDLLARLGYLAD